VETLDPRLNVFRADLADEHLRGRVEAASFVKGELNQFVQPITAILKRPEETSPQTSQALFGEICDVFEIKDGYAWVQMQRDGYVGYVSAEAVSRKVEIATHRVSETSTLVYPAADLKTQPTKILTLNASLKVVSQQGSYCALATGGFIFAKHLSPLTEPDEDFVAVAEKFLHVPYYWGGKTVQGLDCSGLVQISLHASGIESPRDSDMQERALGNVLKNHAALQRGDLVFWPGHVGIMHSATHLLHANGFFMKTVIEPLQHVVARSDTSISSVRRLSVHGHKAA